MAIVAGCATERGIDVRGPVEIRYNIARQRSYITDTQARLAAFVSTNQAAFISHAVHTNVSEGVNNRYMHVKDTRIPIGENGWFYFVCHSWHSEWRNYTYCDVGDLSIGIDNAGNYYFCRTHVCGSLIFRLPALGSYSSMDDFMRHNPDWHPLPEDWTERAPPAPEIDIASYVIGMWHATTITSETATTGIDIEFTEYGSADVRIKGDVGESWGGTSYQVLSPTTLVLTNSFFGGTLELKGKDLIGTITEPVEDNAEMERLMATRQTNTDEVIYNHTNRYTCKFVKGEPGTASNKVPEDAARKLADPQH